MPGLRRPDAHRRDIPPWPATQIPRATEAPGRMTRCPSVCPKLIPICPVFRDNVALRQACRIRQNRRDTTADGLKNQPQSHHRQLSGHPDCCCRASRSPPAPRFPHRLHPAPRGFLLGRFFNAGRHSPTRHRHATARIEKPSPIQTYAPIC